MAKHVAVVGLLILCATASSVAQTHNIELPLVPGPFAAVRGARLGNAVNFENEIDTHSCLPLIIGGKTIAWFERAYSVEDRLFARRCTASGSSDSVTKGNRAGGANDSWDRVSFDARGRVRFSRLSLPMWSFMSNPSFCDSYVAYWALQGEANNVVPSVYDLLARTRVASVARGAVTLETDDEAYLPRPIWDASCAKALFDGRPIKKSQIALAVAK